MIFLGPIFVTHPVWRFHMYLRTTALGNTDLIFNVIVFSSRISGVYIRIVKSINPLFNTLENYSHFNANN